MSQVRRGVVLAMVVALGAMASAGASQEGLSVKITKLKSDVGHVGCILWNSEAGFPTDPKAAVQHAWCGISGSVASCTFGTLPPGTYAVACYHDENDNRKLDTGFMGIPTEGFVVSNEAKGFMGPPKFKDAKFILSPTTSTRELVLRMSY